MELQQTFQLARGFSFRRESFGGILYHYEGVAPDPRVYFVGSAFLLDLLDAVSEHPDEPLEGLISQATSHFKLSPSQRGGVFQFFETLVERGALVPK